MDKLFNLISIYLYMIKLSGAIGITILSKNMNDKIKKIYIFADNHNKDKYCSYNFSTGNNIKKFLFICFY